MCEGVGRSAACVPAVPAMAPRGTKNNPKASRAGQLSVRAVVSKNEGLGGGGVPVHRRREAHPVPESTGPMCRPT